MTQVKNNFVTVKEIILTMKILFSPEFSGHVYLALNDQQDHLMDTMVCDMMGLIRILEQQLGLHVEETSTHYRTVKYYKALSEYMRQHPKNVLSASFKLSSLGTAEQALRWRDSLKLDQWQADTTGSTGSGRLTTLAGAEPYFDSPGLPDRLQQVTACLQQAGEIYLQELEIELPCDMHLLHPAVRTLLSEAERHGAAITPRERPKVVKDGNNLQRLSQLLQSHSLGKIRLDKADRSFVIYKFADDKAANEYLALKGDELHADVWINSANKTLDNWLRLMGKPAMGSMMAKSTPQMLQLFVLGLDIMKEPLNIKSLISWLYAPMQPLGTYFGSLLAETIIAEGGYRNERCRGVVADYLEGRYTYHDEEAEAQLTEQEKAKRHEREKKERQLLVETYLPPFDTQSQDSIDTVKLRTYLNSLAGWARSRAHYLREKDGQEGWCSQLESLAEMCGTFVLLIESAGADERIGHRQIESWVSTLYKGETFEQYAPQKGSRELIDSPAKMAVRSQRTVWMHFMGGDAHPLDCSFLYPTEREQVKGHLTLWEEADETAYQQTQQLLPFTLTDDQLILVVTDYTDGEPTPKHPIMVRLESQVENLSDFVEKPHLLGESTVDVKTVSNSITQPQLAFDHADLLQWPDHVSPTTISTLVEYPFDYLMEYMLRIEHTGPSSIGDIKATKGTVAHAVIEALFAPRDGKRCSTAAEIEERIAKEFDEQVQRQIEACGAILYLPENRLDAELLKQQLRRCLDTLLGILHDNQLTVTGCEHYVKSDMGLLPNEKGWDMAGSIDMTLEDEQHHPVVFDFKWTSSRNYHRNLLTANRSTQLELYRTMLSQEQRDTVERTAYFLMPEGHLYSKERFEGDYCTQLRADNDNDIVEELRQSFFYRKQQMDGGQVEISEGFPLSMLDYYNDTQGKHLFPLESDGTGMVKSNIFSNYQLFKK